MTESMVKNILKSLMAESSRKFSESEKVMKFKTWMLALNDLTDEQGMIGFEKAIKMPNEFMLSSGKFRELCITSPGSQSIENQALEAWNLVYSNLNSYNSPVFKDSSISEAIRKMGGWSNLCLMLETEEPFKRKDFVELYSMMKRKGQEFDPMLTGTFKDNICFIGYDENDDTEQILLDIEKKQNSDKNILKMIQDGR
jgi:hypothetical protein